MSTVLAKKGFPESLVCCIIIEGMFIVHTIAKFKEESEMSKIRAIKSVLAGMLAGTMVFSAASVFPTGTFTQELDANATGACTINTNKLYQRIRGFGGMNHPEWQSYNAQNGAPGDMTAAQVQTAFGNGANEPDSQYSVSS